MLEVTLLYPNQETVVESVNYDDLIDDILLGEELTSHLDAYDITKDALGNDVLRIYGTEDNGEKMRIDVRSDNLNDLVQLEAYLNDVINRIEENEYEEEY